MEQNSREPSPSWNVILHSFGVTTDRQSTGLFGLTTLMINVLGGLYLKWVNELELSLKQFHLLWFLYFAKNYPPNEFVCSTFFGVDQKTFHKYCYAVLGLLYKKLDLVCSFSLPISRSNEIITIVH
jgi:hypothetical protein